MSEALAEHIYLELVKLVKHDSTCDITSPDYCFPSPIKNLIKDLDSDGVMVTKKKLTNLLLSDLQSNQYQLKINAHVTHRNAIINNWSENEQAFHQAYYETAAEQDIYKSFLIVGIVILAVTYLWIPEVVTIPSLKLFDLKYIPAALFFGCGVNSFFRFLQLKKSVEPNEKAVLTCQNNFNNLCHKTANQILDNLFNTLQKDDDIDNTSDNNAEPPNPVPVENLATDSTNN